MRLRTVVPSTLAADAPVVGVVAPPASARSGSHHEERPMTLCRTTRRLAVPLALVVTLAGCNGADTTSGSSPQGVDVTVATTTASATASATTSGTTTAPAAATTAAPAATTAAATPTSPVGAAKAAAAQADQALAEADSALADVDKALADADAALNDATPNGG